MKRCVECGTSFDSEDWRCLSCGFSPLQHDTFLSFCNPKGSDGFDPGSFDHLVAVEPTSFWFRSRNRLIISTLRRYFPHVGRLLEIGCGTGFVLEALGSAFPQLNMVGAELHADGLAYAAQRVPQTELMQFDARAIPFDREFDVIGAFDVIEHIDSDERVLAEMHNAVRPGGGIILTIPQHPWLWSRIDEYAEHKRRYRRSELLEKLSSAGFQLRRVTSFISFLLPAMVAARMRERVSRGQFDPSREHNATKKAAFLLERVVDVERYLIGRGISLPVGGSLLVVATRS